MTNAFTVRRHDIGSESVAVWNLLLLGSFHRCSEPIEAGGSRSRIGEVKPVFELLHDLIEVADIVHMVPRKLL